jgi:hypothetical protein
VAQFIRGLAMVWMVLAHGACFGAYLCRGAWFWKFSFLAVSVWWFGNSLRAFVASFRVEDAGIQGRRR